jgi:subtilisin-like proprotein convertase family protein
MKTAATNRALWYFDQSPAESLSTDQQRTRTFSVSQAVRSLPLRVTLVWSDPPGNPVAGLKLVNDLDLVVTNLDTGEVFWGNDIPPGGQFNSAWQPGTPPHLDQINNVENVLLPPTLASNYSVTVLGRRISVNAVREQPAGTFQDYALVISSGDGQYADGLTATAARDLATPIPLVTFITNNFDASSNDAGAVLLRERVGASQASFGTNTIPLTGRTNLVINIGSTNQWHFYVFTNDSEFTNAVFLTFFAKPLSTIPADSAGPGFQSSGQIALAGADVDLYVSRDAGLTNLDPAVLAAADISFNRGGAETIIYSNAAPGLYYIGVKCESLQGAEYGFLADVSLEPFAQTDPLGNEILRGFPEPAVVPAGTTAIPGVAQVFYVTPDTTPLRRVIVTNTIDYSIPTDLQTTLTHNSASVVLNNHSGAGPSTNQTFVFDDSGEGDVPGSIPSAGPGSLRLFSGQDGAGQWILLLTSTNSSATNQSSTLFLERQQDPAGTIGANILPGACREDFVSVPVPATNLTGTLSFTSGTGPVSLQVYSAESSPTNCATVLVPNLNSTGVFNVDDTSQPPLNPGLYVVQTCNLGPDEATVVIQASTLSGPPPPTNFFVSDRKVIIQENALTSSTLMVTNTDQIVSAEVGVRIDHPRISDLILSLISPDGTRVLLDGGRGGGSSDGMGANAIVTNTTPVSFSGGPQGITNVFETGENAGTILIDYDFFALPDDMRVYYQDQLLFDSGLVSFTGSTNLGYGPGAATTFSVIMNQGGNSESNTAWFYSVTSTRVEPLYLTFTENTNLTQTPIKFAPPPFTNSTVTPGTGAANGGIFYLPEESLAQLAGKSAFGQWKLEIWDSRSGTTNPQPTLVSWQLALTLARSVPLPVPLATLVTATNLLGPGQIQWYEIAVPDWVSFVTNSLFSSSQPVNLFFNPATPPTGTNAGDQLLAVKSSSGQWIFSTNTPPVLVPGASYFLGIQNTNPATATLVFGIEFDVTGVTTLTSGEPFANINPGPLNYSDFYRFVVSTNAARVQFEVNGPTNDVTLLAKKGPPLPSLSSYDFISSNPGTNDELIVAYDYSRPVPLTPGEWFLTVVNVTGSPAAYSILATEFPAYGTNILVSGPAVIGNTLCLTWPSLSGIHYFVQAKAGLNEPDWTTVSSTITASDVSTTFCIPLPSEFEYYRVSEGIVLVPALPIISSLVYTTNATVLQWSAPTNLLFQVQWSPSLVPATWQSVPGQVISSNGTFLFSDDGSQTGGRGSERFYRLRQLP